MKASEAFLLGLPRRVFNERKKKVFIIDFHKTGTSSMGKAFQVLGYRVCGNVKEGQDFEGKDENPRDYILSKALNLTPRFDCFQDTPWFMFYKELYDKYPDAYFILTIRPDEDWIRSVRDHFGNRNNSSYHKWIYGYLDPLSHEDIYLKKYQEHNESVKEFFRDKDNFIEISLLEKDKWGKLCTFLDVPEPKTSFPYVNTSTSRKQFYHSVKQKVKNLYYR